MYSHNFDFSACLFVVTQALDSADSKTTCTIIVVNLPTTADEDLLEVFFESKKKYGGGPVKDVKIERDKNRAYVTFCEVSAVETVMKKKPIMLGTTELSVKPYTPLLSGSEAIGRIDVIGLPVSKDFTEGLLKRYSDPHPSPISTHRQPPTPTYGHRQPTTPTYGPELAALIKVGTRVVRGKDWKWGNDDGGGKGTITDLKALGLPGCFQVQWDAGLEGIYRMGAQGSYELQLAPES